MAVRIGVISDTHGFFDSSVFTYFEECQEIWHAGDIGDLLVTEQLAHFKKLRAVYGNIDGISARNYFNETELFEIEGVKVCLTHIAGPFEKYNSTVKQIIKDEKPNLLVCGHSHICKVAYDKTHQLLYMNPGAAGNHGFHFVKTILRFTIEKGKMKDLEVIELGKRGKIA